MQEVKQYPPNTFSWVDLATTDYEGAKAFYTALFGWTAQDIPVGDDGVYGMLFLEGKEVAGLFPLGAELLAQNIPPHWKSYISVENVDETVTKVADLGGAVLAPPFDVFDNGRMAVIQDPTGAVVSLWEPKNHIGARLVNIPNTFVWNELLTSDTAAAATFYNALCDWSAQESEMPNGTIYTAFQNNSNERFVGGMMPLTPEMGPIPPHWGVYFMVEHCQTATDKAVALGANLVMPLTEIPNMGRFSLIQDPQGAHFYLMELERVDPPPGY